MAATEVEGQRSVDWDPESEERTRILMVDISRAYFNAKTGEDRQTYVELPTEHPEHGNKVRLLLQHVYGTGGAADGWQGECSFSFTELGPKQGLSSPRVSRQRLTGVICAVHGGDFTFVGPTDELIKVENKMMEKYQLTKGAFRGPGEGDDKEGVVLNRVVRWCENSTEYEADPRQAEEFVYEWGSGGAKSVCYTWTQGADIAVGKRQGGRGRKGKYAQCCRSLLELLIRRSHRYMLFGQRNLQIHG